MEERLEHLERKVKNLEDYFCQFVYLVQERLEHMALDFSKLQAAVSNVNSNIQTAISLLTNPAVDNNDQATIDQLTSLLQNSSDALAAAEPQPAVTPAPAPVAEPAPAESPAPSTDSAAPASDGSAAPSA